jgi:hypothetical protein
VPHRIVWLGAEMLPRRSSTGLPPKSLCQGITVGSAGSSGRRFGCGCVGVGEPEQGGSGPLPERRARITRREQPVCGEARAGWRKVRLCSAKAWPGTARGVMLAAVSAVVGAGRTGVRGDPRRRLL